MPKGDPVQFNVDIQKWVKKAKGNSDRFVQEFCSDISESIVRRTPRRTGFLANSWWGGKNKIEPQGKRKPEPQAAAATSQIALVCSQLKAGDVYYLYNNANYAHFVEFGTSRMAARAMVRSTFAEAPQVAKQVIGRMPK